MTDPLAKRKKTISRQQLLSDLKKLSDDGELLNCSITRAIEESPCDYEEVLKILNKQKSWMRYARKVEHGY
jgi:hypothetical protein